MLKISLSVAVVFITTISFAQTNILPTNGDVGIGTLTPSAKLDVNGSLMVDSMATFKDSLRVQKKLIVEQDVKIQGKSVFVGNGKFKAELKVLGVGRMKDKLVVDGLTKLNGDLKLMSLSNFPNATKFLTVNQNGKVGSFERISLVNAIYQPPQTCFTDMSGNIYPMWKQNPHQNYGILYTGVDCPARVGIGIDNPTTNLDVIGTARFTKNVGIGTPINSHVQLLVKPSNVNNIGLCIETPNIGNYNYGIKSIMSNPNAKAFAVVDNQDNFIVWGDGRVNIITESSQNIKSFSVIDKSSNNDVFRVMSNGNVYASKVMVRTVPFPDYVFNANYQLMPLLELETYIKENKHLPNMPTASEVEENGADLGKINKVLVEKTEELTLYIIELKKELDNLKEEVNKLKK